MGSCHSQTNCKPVIQVHNTSNGYVTLSNKTKSCNVKGDKATVPVPVTESNKNAKIIKELNNEQVVVSDKHIYLLRYTWFELHREVIKVGSVAFVK